MKQHFHWFVQVKIGTKKSQKIKQNYRKIIRLNKVAKVGKTNFLSSQQHNHQLFCCSKCVQSENGPSFMYQYYEFICNSIVSGTFPLTKYWRSTGFQFKTQILFFYSVNNSDFLNRPPNTNLIVVKCGQHPIFYEC